MKRFITFCIAGMLISGTAFAQPDSLWSRTFGGSADDYCNSVQRTTDGGYILSGSTGSFGERLGDFWLVKTDANGDSLWSQYFGRSDRRRTYLDYCNSVLQTTDGGYILAGSSDGSGEETFSQFWCVKTNARGDSLWTRVFGASDEDYCYSVLQTADGGYILGGTTLDRDSDIRLVKMDANGDTLWCRTLGSNDCDCCCTVHLTADGGLIIGGSMCYGGTLRFELLRTGPNGDSLWSRSFGRSHDDQCRSVQQTTDGGYILGGSTVSFGAGGHDFWLVKTDAAGDSLWSHTFGGSGDDICYSVQQTSDGGYILGGSTNSFGGGNEDFWLVKTDANGDSLWSRTFGGNGIDICHSVRQMADASYVLAGYTNSFGAGNFDCWLVKTGPDLVAEYPRIGTPLSLILSAYPNPFNPSTVIVYDIPRAGHVSLRVFDVLGREVAVLKDEFVEEGSHQTMFDGSRLASGIYFARLDAGKFTQTKKLMLLK